MKRDLSVITPGVRKKIEKWLWTDLLGDCPFPASFKYPDCNICETVFPTSYRCPCLQFNVNYVKRVAREVLKKTK